jgi:tRNA A37 threonylcarbamoyladenosine synthetase subunit TsaC/SUA5/YrdC
MDDSYDTTRIQDDAPWKMKDLVDIMNRGGVGVLPTETGYGLVTRLLVGSVLDDNRGNHGKNAGLERLLRIKNMHATCQTQPLSILCSNVATIDEYCALYTLPKQVFKILKKNLPGPYTFLLQAVKTTTTTTTTTTVVVSSLNDNVTICKANPGWKRDTIGIRMPSDPVLRYFQDELYGGMPLIFLTLTLDDDDDEEEEEEEDNNDSDVNIEMYHKLVRPQPEHWYWNMVDFVVDAGLRPRGDGSTVIDLMTVHSHGGGGGGGAPQLVRSGLGALELTI